VTHEVESSYYAVIPAEVRYDKDLKPNAKLLYGELTSLCNKKGYCWATNEYFADLYDLSVGTISRLISQLEGKGYIRCEMAATDAGSERRIYAGIFLAEQGGLDENDNTPGGLDEMRKRGVSKKRKRGLDENVKQNNTSMNNKELKNPPIAPQGGPPAEEPKRRKRAPKSIPVWKPERFERFWACYPRGEDRISAVKEWDKLRADDDLLRVMGQALERQKASEAWRAGIGIPYACRWLKHRRWEDGKACLGTPPGEPPKPTTWGWGCG